MKRILTVIIIFAISCLANKFEVDKNNSNIGFIAKYLSMSNINGNFRNYETLIDFDTKNNIPTKIEAVIFTSSISTKNPTRDTNLTSDEFFDTEKFNKINFKMTEFKNNKIYGILQIKGSQKNIALNYKYINNATYIKKNVKKHNFTITTNIKRSEFDIGTDYPKELINDDILVVINIQGFTKEE